MAELSRPRVTLRLRVFLTILLVVLLPLPLVWLSEVADTLVRGWLSVKVDAAAASAEAAWKDRPDADARARSETIAQYYAVRIRVVTEAGPGADVDRIAFPWVDRPFTGMLFGPDAVSYTEADASLGDIRERPEFVAANQPMPVERPTGSLIGSGTLARQRTGESRCATPSAALMVICSEARVITLHDGRQATLHVETMSRRVFRLVYDTRYPLILIVGVMVVLGSGVVLWLNRRLVTPLEDLRDRVIARRRGDQRSLLQDRRDEIGDLGRAFDELVTALEERNRSNAAFMVDLVHEMKNPVSALRAVGEALEGGRSDPERARRYAKVILDSSARLDGVVTQFLELARAEAGLPEQERVAVDLLALATGVVEEFRASHAEIVFTLEGAPASAVAVADGVETIVRNLLDNAAQFGQHVDVRVGSVADLVTVSVADDGPGIEAADLAKVFDRFFTRRAGGTGLGLALSQAIARAHGGRIEVRSAPGRGAVFVLLLPRG